MTTYTIFIFRRDLRLHDNIALNYAIDNYKNIIPIFIFTPEQVINNEYFSQNGFQFMVNSLYQLNIELDSCLHFYYGTNISILTKLIKKMKIGTIIFNMDYTPYAIERDKSIEQLCIKNGIECIKLEDYLLHPINTIKKDDGTPYRVFTPYKNKFVQPKKPMKSKIGTRFIKVEKTKLKYKQSNNVQCGMKAPKNYDNERNLLSKETSRLSACIKFGRVSIREVYWNNKSNEFRTQLIWHDFYYNIVYNFPKVLKGENFKYKELKWTNNNNHFDKWKNGETGFPIVDAGMRQLNATGYMHNRARLITANFLTRHLMIDWRKGEKYYASKLTDYDPSINNGNWQWVAGTGVDTKPYEQRIFNPWSQSKKYDKDAKYIKKWIPSLDDIEANKLHNWSRYYKEYNLDEINYYRPIIEYKKIKR